MVLQIVRRWKVLLLYFLGFSTIGISTYLMTPNLFQSIAYISQEGEQSGNNRGLNNIASLAGINLDQGSIRGTGLNAMLYSSIVSSAPFLHRMVNETIKYKNAEILLKEFLLFESDLSLYEKLRFFKWRYNRSDFNEVSLSEPLIYNDPNPFLVSGVDRIAIQKLNNNLNLTIKPGEPIEISSLIQDPEVAAQVVTLLIKNLEIYIDEYEKNRFSKRLDNMIEQVEMARVEFIDAQNRLVEAQDKNLNLSTAKSKSEIERLDAEYRIKFNVYNNISLQLQSLILKENEQRVSFIVIEPPLVNKTPSQPKWILFVIFSFFGALVAFILHFSLVNFKDKNF
ncbi:MAG: hypothetical protein ACXIUQ_12015 [Cecembia sp.]